MSPILIDLGFMQIRWYSILILSAFVIGYLLVINRCKKKGIPTSAITDMCFYLVIICILGARLHYCLFYVNEFGNNPYFSNPLDIIKIWEGGLGIHGGIIAGLVFTIVYTKKKKINLLEILDVIAPALALGQCIGRWGNFFNQEAFGRITTLSNLKSLHIPKFIIDGMFIEGEYREPTFLFESIGCLLIFILLISIRNIKKIKNGQIISLYFILYGILRFFIESLRTDSLMFMNLKMAQIISIIMILGGLFLFIKPYIRSKNDK